MKRLFLICLIPILFLNPYRVEADSYLETLVAAELNINDLSPEKRIAHLLSLCEKINKSNVDSMSAYLNELKYLTKKYGSPEDQANTYWKSAIAFRLKGEFDLALPDYLLAVDQFRDNDQNMGVAGVLNDIGYLFFKVNEFDQAKHYYYDALYLYEEHQSIKDVIKLNYNLSACFRKEKMFKEALNYANTALNQSLKINDQIAANKSYNYLGIIYYEMGDLDSARENYIKSIANLDQIKNQTRPLAYGYNNIGETYRDQKDFLNAHKYFNKALVQKRKLNNPDLTASTLINIGKLHTIEGAYMKGINVLSEAISLISPDFINENLTEAIKEISSAYKMAQKSGLSVDLEPIVAYNEMLINQFALTENYRKELTRQHQQYMVEKSLEKQQFQASIGQLKNTKLYLIWGGIFVIVLFLLLIYLMNHALVKAQRKSLEVAMTLNEMKSILGQSFKRMQDDGDTFKVTTKK